MLDFVGIAFAAVKMLAPVLPHLMKLGEKAGETVEELAHDTIKEQATKVWKKLTGRFTGDKQLEAAATMVASEPADQDYRKMLTKVLAERLTGDEAFAKQLLEDVGGAKRLEEVVAGDESLIAAVRMKMKGAGTMSVRAGNKSTIIGVSQDMEG